MNDWNSEQFVVSNFISLESELITCLDFIPFIDTNLEVISPKFIPIIMESCSMIDSIFRKLAGDKSIRSNLKKYAETFEPHIELESDVTLFLSAPIRPLTPFKAWRSTTPTWWIAYNSLKHDRLHNYHHASIPNAVLALAGLHQLMARDKSFIGSFLNAGWIDTIEEETMVDIKSVAFLGALTPSPPSLIVESRLFATPTRENFVRSYDGLYFDIDYGVNGLSQRLRNLLTAHEDL
jgi:hypothetical protein